MWRHSEWKYSNGSRPISMWILFRIRILTFHIQSLEILTEKRYRIEKSTVRGLRHIFNCVNDHWIS